MESRKVSAIVDAGQTVRVHLSDGSELTLDVETVVRVALQVGTPVDAAKEAELMAEERMARAYRRALFFLSYRPRSTWEVRMDLRHHGWDDVAGAVTERLIREGYLNDADFARMWVRERLREGKRSRRHIAYELMEKRIPSELAEVALREVNTEAELRTALRLARRYIKGKGRDLTRTLRYLAQRGFSRDVIETVGRELRTGKLASLGDDEAHN
ncbi:MAG: RecX family transcriptional regulator [Candidatus Carbobacillus altaicus]|nr:RecX family transcriptional regulator [Candidatus Carbobacillus altaicus]